MAFKRPELKFENLRKVLRNKKGHLNINVSS